MKEMIDAGRKPAEIAAFGRLDKSIVSRIVKSMSGDKSAGLMSYVLC